MTAPQEARMTTLQEAAQKAIELFDAQWQCSRLFSLEEVQDVAEELRTALAQQGEQQPVAWYEYNQDLDAWFLAYGHNPKAKTRPLVFGDTAAPAPQPAQQVPATCVWTKDSDFEMGDTYDSSCGEKWSFIDGGPTENRVSFCQGCGKPVKLVQDIL